MIRSVLHKDHMISLRHEVDTIRTSSLARNAGWMLIGQGFSIVLQTGYFVLLARILGVREYGIFAGAFAFTTIAMPYSALGSGTLLMRYVGDGSGSFSEYWGNVLISTFCVGGAVVAILCLLAPHLLNPASASIIILVAIGNCIFSQLVVCIGQVFQTFEQLHIAAIITLLTNLLRLLAVTIMAFVLHRATAWQWAVAFLSVSMLAALVGSIIVTVRFGRPRFASTIFHSKAIEGFSYSLGGSSQSVYNDIDKTLLSHYGMNVQNGIYTMAYRVIDMATMPVTAMDSAALPRYFRKSSEGLANVRALSFRLAKRAAFLGLLLSSCTYLAAPLIPRIVGPGFAESVLAVRWLCLLPVFRALHQLTGSAIAGMGLQRFRTMTQLTAAALNLGLTLWLIPLYGWRGAAWASLVTDGALGALNWVVLQNVVHTVVQPRRY